MAGKLKWFCAVALGLAAAAGTDAQTPDDGHDMPKAETLRNIPTPVSKTDAPTVPIEELPARPRFYVEANYILWWLRRGPLPEQALVTTSSDKPINGSSGIVGQPNTQTLFGRNDLQWGGSSGVAATIGWNFTPDADWGIAATGFVLPRQTLTTGFSSNAGSGIPLITRPFFDTINNLEAAYDVSFPTLASGSINIQATTELWGYEVNVTHQQIGANGTNLDMYFGFRSLGLDETLQFDAATKALAANTVTYLGNSIPIGSQVTTTDFFGTKNRFYGPQLGGGFNWHWGRLGATLTGKIAMGVNRQTVMINGDTTGLGTVTAGGVLAQPSNSGIFNRDVFCLVPELNLKLDYEIRPWVHAHFGYNLLYWSSVVRPGSQIDRNIDITQVPIDQNYHSLIAGLPSQRSTPAFTFRDTDFWAQGLNVGLEFRY